jgi:hypothetical protein
VEEGTATSDIAGWWPQGQPAQLRTLWQEMKAALLATKQDWDVWTDWYEARLEGRVNDEERELAYVRIEEALWAQGPAVVNAEIKKRIEEPPQPGVVQLQGHSSSGETNNTRSTASVTSISRRSSRRDSVRSIRLSIGFASAFRTRKIDSFPNVPKIL